MKGEMDHETALALARDLALRWRESAVPPVKVVEADDAPIMKWCIVFALVVSLLGWAAAGVLLHTPELLRWTYDALGAIGIIVKS